MNRSGDDNLEQLLALAKAYNRKYRQLTDIAGRTPLAELLPGMIQQAELITDRARAAQQSLAPILAAEDPDDSEPAAAALSLSKCFDEILILFQVLADKAAPQAS